MFRFGKISLFIKMMALLLGVELVRWLLYSFDVAQYWLVSIAVVTFVTLVLFFWLKSVTDEQERLGEQEERLNSVLDTVKTAIATITDKGVIESFNEAAQRMFGYSAEEVVGKNVKMLMPDEYKHRHDGYLQNYKETGKASIIGLGRELVGVRKNGQTFPLFLQVGQIDLENRRLFTGVMEDLSQLKATESSENQVRQELEKELVNSAEQKVRLESIVNTVGTAIITITDRGMIESFNEAAQKIFGYSDTEVFGKNVKMLMPDEHKHRHDGYLSDYNQTGKASIIGMGRELIGLRKSGEEFPMHLHVGQVDLESRRIFTGAIEDLSNLKHAQMTEKESREALEREKIRLEEQDWIKTSLVKVSTNLPNMTDIRDLANELLNTTLPLINAELGVFYYSEKDHNDSSFTRYGTYGITSDNFHAERIKADEGLVGEAIKRASTIHLTDVPEDYIYSVGSSLGQARPRQVIIIPIVFDGNALAVVEVASFQAFTTKHLELLSQIADNLGQIIFRIESSLRTELLLSETQKQAEKLQANEEELKLNNEELGRQSKAMERHNRQLEEAQVEIEETSRYKSEFLANMSHELRTPLNSLLILSKMLSDNKEGNLSSNQQRNAETIYRSGNDLLDLINDILDLSKVEAGQMVANHDTMTLKQLAIDLEDLFASTADEKGLAFDVVLAADLPNSIITDEQRLTQILRNFLSNAFKFTKVGKVRLDIRLVDDSDALRDENIKQPTSIAFVVSDTGIGIPEGKEEMIFLAFQQIDSSIQREFGGTGLGLSITKQLADLLCGEVQVSSTEGEGSQFTFYLPQSTKATKRHTKGRSTLTKQSAVGETTLNQALQDDRKSLNGARQTILLLEDDPKFSLVVAELVREQGFNILICTDGAEGYVLAKEHQPIGIIVDLALAGVSGQAAISNIKDDPLTRHIPVHIVSGTASSEEFKGRGIIGFMQKPVSEHQLVSIFERFTSVAKRNIDKLLLVEDDGVQADHIKALLDNQFMQITHASTAKEAGSQLETNAFDCMVLDLTLPDQDGLSLLKSLNKTEQLQNLPIIVYTARDLSQEEHQELQLYAEDIIQKSEKGAEKLLDEVVMFLHRIESKLPSQQREVLNKLHNVEAILSDKKVLLVDDDMRNIYALSAALEEKSMQVVIAKNGVDALEKLKEHSDIDIVLMDIMMPEMDGYEAMRLIRDDAKYAQVPIIALTAKALQHDRALCLEAGASDYISKPIEIERLFSLMRVWLY